MNRIIAYAIDQDTGLVWSRVGHELAVPVLQWDTMVPENNFSTSYALERCDLRDMAYATLRWTKKIPVAIKNRHRVHWGMKELP